MRLVSFRTGGSDRYGVEAGDDIIDVAASIADSGLGRERPLPITMVQFLETGDWGLARLPYLVDHAQLKRQSSAGQPLVHDRADVRLLAPIPRPPQGFGIGRNYSDHAGEVRQSVPGLPKMSLKVTNTVIGPGEAVVLPSEARFLDYEAELCIVIGKLAQNVSERESLNYVAGYSIINDMGMKDIQSRNSQTILGKNFRTFTPLGPAIVTTDEVPDPQDLKIRLWVNGDLRQDGTTRDMVYGVRTIVSFLSHVCDLEPGAVIHTGSPAGVGWAMNPPTFLQPGDVMKIELTTVGTLENPVVKSEVSIDSLKESGVNWPSLEQELVVPVPGRSTV